jgi:hypothetical protein
MSVAAEHDDMHILWISFSCYRPQNINKIHAFENTLQLMAFTTNAEIYYPFWINII